VFIVGASAVIEIVEELKWWYQGSSSWGNADDEDMDMDDEAKGCGGGGGDGPS
jgi:hypothetical protein